MNRAAIRIQPTWLLKNTILLLVLSITLLIFTQPHPFYIRTLQLSPFAPIFPRTIKYIFLSATLCPTLNLNKEPTCSHFMAFNGLYLTHPAICTDCVMVCGWCHFMPVYQQFEASSYQSLEVAL